MIRYKFWEIINNINNKLGIISYSYFISYVIDFNTKVEKDNQIKHNWNNSNMWFTISDKINSNDNIASLYTRLQNRHNCAFLSIINIQIIRINIFHRAKRFKDFDIKGFHK